MDTYRCAEVGGKVPGHHDQSDTNRIVCLFKTRFIFITKIWVSRAPLTPLADPASINMFCVFLELFYYQISIFIRHGVVLYSQELLRRVAISVAAFEDILVPMP